MISSGHALHMLGDMVDASVPAKADHQHMIDKQTHQDTDMSTGKEGRNNWNIESRGGKKDR